MSKTKLTPDEELCSEGVLTKFEAAAMLGVSVRTLEDMLKDGKLPYTRSNKAPKIPKLAVIRHLAKGLVGAGTG